MNGESNLPDEFLDHALNCNITVTEGFETPFANAKFDEENP